MLWVAHWLKICTFLEQSRTAMFFLMEHNLGWNGSFVLNETQLLLCLCASVFLTLTNTLKKVIGENYFILKLCCGPIFIKSLIYGARCNACVVYNLSQRYFAVLNLLPSLPGVIAEDCQVWPMMFLHYILTSIKINTCRY